MLVNVQSMLVDVQSMLAGRRINDGWALYMLCVHPVYVVWASDICRMGITSILYGRSIYVVWASHLCLLGVKTMVTGRRIYSGCVTVIYVG